MGGVLRKVLYLLGILDDQDVEWMVRNGSRKEVPEGTAIIREGQPSEALFFVLSGEFGVTSGKMKGEISHVLEGEVVGEVSFVDSRPPSATVTAKRDSVVGAVPAAKLRRKLEEDAGFASRFYKSMAVTLADRLRVRTTMGYKAPDGTQIEDDEDDIAPEQLDALSMAGNRFAEMKRRRWGA
ncbi:cyclic nucleotide-binding domain-containing protein [Acidobacteria bacterium ACD]|nr:MAG: cyclic nucleotide-binding protein [Acidobacteriota bacterium]MCE7957547.1 cyclic nucleotide-binding protein [Acidobacteria bacterium ACB2]MDL1950071.1 cyclic nucleotide-binding domain-containing protein [Acidobacteria bacterium ACD]